MWNIVLIVVSLGLFITGAIGLRKDWPRLSAFKRRLDSVFLITYGFLITFLVLKEMPKLEAWRALDDVLLVGFSIYYLTLRFQQSKREPRPKPAPPVV